MSGAAITPGQETLSLSLKQIMGHPAPLWMLFMSEFGNALRFTAFAGLWCCISLRSFITVTVAVNRLRMLCMVLISHWYMRQPCLAGYVADRDWLSTLDFGRCGVYGSRSVHDFDSEQGHLHRWFSHHYYR